VPRPVPHRPAAPRRLAIHHHVPGRAPAQQPPAGSRAASSSPWSGRAPTRARSRTAPG